MKTSGCYTVAGRPLAGGFCSRTGDVLSHAMYSAARNGHSQVVEYLLDRGAAIDAKGVFGGIGVHWAAINGTGIPWTSS